MPRDDTELLHIAAGIAACIIAAALYAGARTLYTEDMRDGQAIDGLTNRNPFSR